MMFLAGGSIWALPLFAAADLAGVAALIVACSGALLGGLGWAATRRTSKESATTGYVDSGLKTMKEAIGWLTDDNTKLRDVVEQQREEISTLKAHSAEQDTQLAECRALCKQVTTELEQWRQQHGNE